jgi:4-hydroxy-tetrahydrodipicolinate synthase
MTIRGVFCAAATPVMADGEPDIARLTAHVKQVIADGCTGIALLGTTGEANSFSVSERQKLLEAVIESGIKPSQLMPGTGLCAAPDTIALTRHALSLGVTSVVMLPPFYYKQPSDDGIFAAYARTIEKIGDSHLKIILYHIPQMSAVPINLPLIEKLIAAYPKTVVGIKDSAGDFANMQKMVQEFPEFAVLAGADPLMKPLLEIGGAGCITATANLVGPQLATIFHHFSDPARSAEVEVAQDHITKVRGISTKFVQIPAIKAMIARRYGDSAWLNVRPPLVALSSAQVDEIGLALTRLS